MDARETIRPSIIKAAELATKHNEKVKLKKEAEELEMKKQLLGSFKEEQAQAFQQKHENKFKFQLQTLEIEHENMLTIEREKVKFQIQTLEIKYENMLRLKTEELERKYNSELNKTFSREKQKLKEVMKAVEVLKEKIESINRLIEEEVTKERPIPPSFICPISLEIMRDPHLAEDGHTYEASAIRGWFATGHDISPMTNLKLASRKLVPNCALRSAIQELGFLEI